MSSPPKIIIIGSGIAGPTLAIALKRVGTFSVTIYERQATGDVDAYRGSWVTFQANGMDALRAIHAATPIVALGFPVQTMTFTSGTGKHLGTVPLAGPRADGTLSRMMQRAELFRALAAEATQSGVDVHLGKDFVTAEQLAGGRVRAHFADGSTDDADLLIGCDGIHSRVRALIDPHAPRPRYVPVLNTGGYVPGLANAVQGTPRNFDMMFGSRCFFGWAPTPDGGLVWFANPPLPQEPARGALANKTDAEWRAWLHELLDVDGAACPAPTVIDAAPGPLSGWATYDLPSVPRWHNGANMVIIGDAAHATAPSSGQGASMALEDAVVLAQCLRDCPSTPSALKTFVHLRRARVERIVAHGAKGANQKAAGPWGAWIRDMILPWVFSYMAKDGGKAMGWLQGHHIEFEDKVVPYEGGE